MRLDLIRHLWGVEQSWDTAFPKIRELGYAGIEASLPDPAHAAQFKELLKEHGLSYVAQVYTAGKTRAEHLQSLERDVDRALGFEPRFVNAHSGSDRFSHDDALGFYEAALTLERKAGITIAHETHRGRAFYSPWVTTPILTKFPELKLTCDFSHWVCVAGRLLDEALDGIALAAKHALHLHARVGHENAPQVADPRAPEYQPHLAAHERYWDLCWQSQRERGLAVTTLTPEFGPPTYMPTLPYTRAPVTNLWDVCNWQAQRQAERFAQRFG